MPTLFQVRSFFTYWLDAVDEHSLHSPFYYDFYVNVVRGSQQNNIHGAGETARQKFLKDSRSIPVDDLGKGSVHFNTTTRSIGDIARTSLSNAKFSKLYTRIIEYFGAKTVLELGTSLGVNTLYLAEAPETKVITFEGAPALAKEARQLFEDLKIATIEIVEGNLDQTLSLRLSKMSKIDFAFVDANHTFEATTHYVNQLFKKSHAKTVIVLDDIHHTPEMEKAWHTLRDSPLVYGSIDLYRCGLLFFDPSLNKRHVVLQF